MVACARLPCAKEQDVKQGTSVLMVRECLDDVARCALPEGCRFRPYRPGDAETWTRLWVAADPFGQVDESTFAREFGDDDARLAERMVFLCDAAGREVGTVTAWMGRPDIDPEAGVVHWVALAPEVQGRGLARVLVAQVLLRLRQLGYGRAYLITQEARLAAIRTYLGFGFVPRVRDEAERAAWDRVRSQLPAPGAQQVDAALRSGRAEG
jgi:mycothiol synthase